MARDMRPVTLDEVEAGMSRAQRARVDKIAAEMRAEELSLAQIRKARSITQSVLARRLGKSQALVSHIESAGDLFISTLRNQVEALGGKLDIRANFPDMPTVSITGFVCMPAQKSANAAASRKAVLKGSQHKNAVIGSSTVLRTKSTAKLNRFALKA